MLQLSSESIEVRRGGSQIWFCRLYAKQIITADLGSLNKTVLYLFILFLPYHHAVSMTMVSSGTIELVASQEKETLSSRPIPYQKVLGLSQTKPF